MINEKKNNHHQLLFTINVNGVKPFRALFRSLLCCTPLEWVPREPSLRCTEWHMHNVQKPCKENGTIKRFLARAKYKLLNPFNAVQDGLWERVSVCVCAHMRVNMVSIPMKRCVVCHKNVHATILSVFTQECNARASQLFVCWKEEKKYENKKPTQARYIDLNCYGDETHSISSISRIVLTFVTVITKLINSIDKIESRSLWRASDGSSFSRDWTTFFFLINDRSRFVASFWLLIPQPMSYIYTKLRI